MHPAEATRLGYVLPNELAFEGTGGEPSMDTREELERRRAAVARVRQFFHGVHERECAEREAPLQALAERSRLVQIAAEKTRNRCALERKEHQRAGAQLPYDAAIPERADWVAALKRKNVATRELESKRRAAHAGKRSDWATKKERAGQAKKAKAKARLQLLTADTRRPLDREQSNHVVEVWRIQGGVETWRGMSTERPGRS